MSLRESFAIPRDPFYPESDGQPIAESHLQFEWIAKIAGNLDYLFMGDPNICVGADFFWYPIEGDNITRIAPDAMVAFGRPKGDRSTYRQWVEGGIAPHVVFEVRSHYADDRDMDEKLRFYDRFGVEEFYEVDPLKPIFRGWLRPGKALVEIETMPGWVSPRLGIQFEWGETLKILHPNGRPFLTFREWSQLGDEAKKRADEARHRRIEAEQKANQASHRREAEQLRADTLAERLRELGPNPEE